MNQGLHRCLQHYVARPASGDIQKALSKAFSTKSASPTAILSHFLFPLAFRSPPPQRRHSRLLSKLDRSPFFRRHLSTTSLRRAVIVAVNPRQDEEGKDMLVDITPRAAHRLREIMAKEDNSALALRVTVQSGGCHGFQYVMVLTDTVDKDDTVFETANEEIRRVESEVEDSPVKDRKIGTARVAMDEASLELLKGSSVDYTMELIGSQFRVVGNPAAQSSCGCGTSFDIKV